jgi:hypothetical protein
VGALREQLSRGDKSLIGNKGYRKYLKTQGQRFAIDEQKISKETRYDGKWVLRTNTDLPTAEVALKYKQLWMVEDSSPWCCARHCKNAWRVLSTHSNGPTSSRISKHWKKSK